MLGLQFADYSRCPVRPQLDITHSAHLYFFRKLVERMRREGHGLSLQGIAPR